MNAITIMAHRMEDAYSSDTTSTSFCKEYKNVSRIHSSLLKTMTSWQSLSLAYSLPNLRVAILRLSTSKCKRHWPESFDSQKVLRQLFGLSRANPHDEGRYQTKESTSNCYLWLSWLTSRSKHVNKQNQQIRHWIFNLLTLGDTFSSLQATWLNEIGAGFFTLIWPTRQSWVKELSSLFKNLQRISFEDYMLYSSHHQAHLSSLKTIKKSPT